ncbi:MAG TPA: DUF4142 domain-containing protein [Bacteroidia bacterium]
MNKIITILVFAASFMCMQAQTVSDRDRKFAEKAAMANLMEIKLGELAQTNGQSAEVKMHGSHMVRDHSKANENLSDLAKRKNVSVPTSLDEKHMKAYNKLAKKTGKEFDKAYIKCMVKKHKKAVCLFEKEEKKGGDSEFRSFASSTLPTLKDHKQMSKEICKTVKRNS